MKETLREIISKSYDPNEALAYIRQKHYSVGLLTVLPLLFKSILDRSKATTGLFQMLIYTINPLRSKRYKSNILLTNKSENKDKSENTTTYDSSNIIKESLTKENLKDNSNLSSDETATHPPTPNKRENIYPELDDYPEIEKTINPPSKPNPPINPNYIHEDNDEPSAPPFEEGQNVGYNSKG